MNIQSTYQKIASSQSDHEYSSTDFKQSNVTYQEFNKVYESSYSSRIEKWQAIRTGIYSGVVQTISDIANLILIVSVSSDTDKKTQLKIQSFHIARDIQGIYGWITSIFNESHGKFQIEESLYHKERYLQSRNSSSFPLPVNDKMDETIPDNDLGEMQQPDNGESVNNNSLENSFLLNDNGLKAEAEAEELNQYIDLEKKKDSEKELPENDRESKPAAAKNESAWFRNPFTSIYRDKK